MTSDGPILSARRVRKSYKIGARELEILHGVSLDLARGELLALVGASGAGKSTLLHILGLIDRPESGRVTIQGKNAWNTLDESRHVVEMASRGHGDSKTPEEIARRREEFEALPGYAPNEDSRLDSVPAIDATQRAAMRNRQIGFVFQFYHLLPELSAVENVVLPAMIADGPLAYLSNRSAHRERAEGMLVEFGLADRLKHKPSQLSGGERQRVALARALFHDPPLLLADEPTGNLDSTTGAKVLDLIFREQERRQLSMILVTHDMRVARRCQRVLVVQDGLIQADSSLPVPD